MERRLLTGNAAAAWGARLSGVEYIPAFPITPQTEIIETLYDWIDNNEMNGRITMLESEHSMITAAGSASCSGVRVFSATSSQGLLYAMEMIFTVPGWSAPFVLVNVSRGLATPITLEPDHNDILAARDSGCIQIHCSTCQEVLDSVIIAYKIAETPGINIPVIVNQDGFYLSFTREPVEIPDIDLVNKYLPPYKPANGFFSADTHQSRGVAVLGGTQYSYFRYETHLACRRALSVYEKSASEFGDLFGRYYPAVEQYMMDDAEFCFIMTGAFATKAIDAVDRLRNTGLKIGLLRPRLIRPFPGESFRELLKGIKSAAVIDQNISMGKGGILYTDIASELYGVGNDYPILMNYISGLGGRDITIDDFYMISEELKISSEKGTHFPPRMIFTASEMEQMIKLQKIAGTIN